jgi:endonuclease I
MNWLNKPWLKMYTQTTHGRRPCRGPSLGLAAWLIVFGAWGSAHAAYEAPNNTAYNAPTTYYNTASGTGLTLRGNLNTIISANFTMRSYGDSRWAMGSGGTDSAGTHPGGELDQDPNNSSNIRLIYTNTSVSGTWAQGVTGTWNREHVWPKNWLGVTSSQVSNTYKGPASDLFELMPADPDVNSARSNDGYGFYPATTGVYKGATGPFGANTSGGNTYWFPNVVDAGEVSRSIFYMATRYFTASNPLRGTDIQNLEIVNGQPTTFNMGDLNSLLHWNYEYGVDNFERRRNALIYGKSFGSATNDLNPNYFQGNRNPYIDHPEYVWAVYGTDKVSGNIVNNSQISVGAGTVNSDGSSTANVNLGSVLVGSSLSTSSVAFNKTGADPTTFNISAGGNAVITTSSVGSFSKPVVGVGQGIDFGTQSGTMTVGLNASTSTAGLKSGTLTVHNSDLTTSGLGHGSGDADDAVNISASVLDHSNGSFDGSSDANSLTINFGRIGQNSGAGNVHDIGFNLYNLESTAGFTAGLALNTITPSGNAGSQAAISTNLATFSNLAAGSHSGFDADINTSNLGAFSVTYTLGVSDQVLPGATSNAPLTLTVIGTVNQYAPGDFNLDHHVDASDLAPMMLALTNESEYETDYGVSPTIFSEIGDVNGDGSVGLADLQALQLDLINGQGNNSAVPEPASLALLGLGGLFLFRCRRYCQIRQ